MCPCRKEGESILEEKFWFPNLSVVLKFIVELEETNGSHRTMCKSKILKTVEKKVASCLPTRKRNPPAIILSLQLKIEMHGSDPPKRN
jgi:hypothetical protein